MIRITDTFELDEADISFRYIRSPGPGGQNVNKVATTAQLRFDARACGAIQPSMFRRLVHLAGSRMSKDGVIVITARAHRSLAANRQDALERLIALLRKAASPPRRRVATKPSRAAKERRLDTKRRVSGTKKLRGRVTPSD